MDVSPRVWTLRWSKTGASDRTLEQPNGIKRDWRKGSASLLQKTCNPQIDWLRMLCLPELHWGPGNGGPVGNLLLGFQAAGLIVGVRNARCCVTEDGAMRICRLGTEDDRLYDHRAAIHRRVSVMVFHLNAMYTGNVVCKWFRGVS
jgi:hypothetical protein